MPILKNSKHEKFAQAVVSGKENSEAYYDAYGKKDRQSGYKLRQRSDVKLRIAELEDRIARIHEVANAKATETVIERYAITKERILDELARIAFANMMDYIRIGDDGLPYCDFSAIDRDKAVAIQDVHVETGVVSEVDEKGDRTSVPVRKARFRLADKRPALIDLGKQLGMFREKLDVKVESEAKTSEELKAEILAEMAELGILPAPAAISEEPIGIANRNGKGNGTAH